MTAAFWWYLLAGFIIGFCLSTVWEWLYFRQRRMYITDRRIAALEQQLESQKRAAASREIPSEPGVTWTATEYQSPGVLLENETDAQPAPRAAVPVTAAVLRAEQTNGRRSLAVDPAPPWARAAAVHTVANAPLPADAPSGATVAAPESAEIDSHAAEAVAATALVAHAMTADEPVAEQNAAPPPPDAERHAAEAVTAAALVAHAMATDEPTAEQNAAPPPPDAERHAAEAVAATALIAHAMAADEPAAEQNAAPPPPDAERHAAAAAALVAHAMADERTEAQAEAENAPTAAPPLPAESAPVMAPTDADATAVTTEVRGFSARQGYIVSELSPAEFTALKATQKARQAARKAWEQARAVTDYLRNV